MDSDVEGNYSEIVLDWFASMNEICGHHCDSGTKCNAESKSITVKTIEKTGKFEGNSTEILMKNYVTDFHISHIQLEGCGSKFSKNRQRKDKN